MPATTPNTVRQAPPDPRYQPLVVILAAAATGILVDHFAPLPPWAWWAAAVSGLTAAFFLARFATAPHVASNISKTLALLAATAAVAGAWHHQCWHLANRDDLGRYARRKSQPVCVEVVAAESPRALPPATYAPLRGRPSREASRFTVDAVALRDGDTWRPVSGRAVLLVLGKPPNVLAGDRLRCFGQLQAPAPPQNPGEFDRAAYLRASGIHSSLRVEDVRCLSVLETGGIWNLRRQLGRLRAYGRQMLSRYMDPRQAELADAILLGYREELDAGRNTAFLTTGTIHILSISGLHVGILAGALFLFTRLLPIRRGCAVLIVAAVVVTYALMVDTGPPVTRATIIVLVACAAVWLNRRPLGFNTLAAAALVVLAVNPAHLFHTGAQLSFLCVAGLVYVAPYVARLKNDRDPLERLIVRSLGPVSRSRRIILRWATDLLLASAVLWTLTTPLVMARFHILSPVAIPLNVLLWAPVTFGMLSGFGILVFGPFCPPLAHFCGILCNLCFAVLERLIQWAQQLPAAYGWFPGPSDWWLWVFYAAVCLWACFPAFRPSHRICAGLLVAWVAAGLAVSQWPHRRDRLDGEFLSVGHGCAVFLELPSGQTLLYDAGRMGSPHTTVRAISEFLWSRGLRRLDAVVLSHPDLDHYNALPDLLDRFSIGKVFVPPGMFEKPGPSTKALRDSLTHRRIPIHEVCAGDRLCDDRRCRVDVLHPSSSRMGSENARSVVLLVECFGRRILLTGDIESPGLETLLAKPSRPCDIFLAPHHGSRKSNSPALAAWCHPRWVIFSGDGRWNLPEINATYQQSGAETLHTYDSGAIGVQLDAAGVRVEPFFAAPASPGEHRSKPGRQGP